MRCRGTRNEGIVLRIRQNLSRKICQISDVQTGKHVRNLLQGACPIRSPYLQHHTTPDSLVLSCLELASCSTLTIFSCVNCNTGVELLICLPRRPLWTLDPLVPCTVWKPLLSCQAQSSSRVLLIACQCPKVLQTVFHFT